jgi:sporulation protein YlmC with PRC-barrel domain
MDLIRDLLDNQIVDRHQHKMGKVDGIVVELRDEQPPRLSYLEVGMPVLARRIHPQLARWVAALQEKWGAKRSEPVQIPMSLVRDVGIDVEIDATADQTQAMDYEQWLRKEVIQRIPGGN